MSEPRQTSADSKDSLPLVGYTIDQLKNYILRSLGSPIWDVEVSTQQVLDAINDALGKFSMWCPQIRPGALRMVAGKTRYLEGQDVGQGIASIDFVEPMPLSYELFYGNLFNNGPLVGRGLEEMDMWLRWRKTWQRVMSVKPDWFYDEFNKVLLIHNPIDRYHAGVLCYFNYDRTEYLNMAGAQWVKEFALEKARYQYGENMSKFSGAIPGPLKDLQLDTSKRDKAEARMEKMLDKLQGMQTLSSLSID